jgi:hypothetical protein
VVVVDVVGVDVVVEAVVEVVASGVLVVDDELVELLVDDDPLSSDEVDEATFSEPLPASLNASPCAWSSAQAPVSRSAVTAKAARRESRVGNRAVMRLRT